MKVDIDNIVKRIDQLLADNKKIIDDRTYDSVMVEKTVFGTISVINICYGENSPQHKSLLELRSNYIKGGTGWRHSNTFEIQNFIEGLLNTLKLDIEYNLLTSLQNQIAGEIYGDFISLAKRSMDEGFKDPAAVLACGAFEDSMKKFAIKNGIDASDLDLATVVNALKAAGLIKGTQAGVVQSYVKLRNKTFHAQFDKIEMPEVSSLIAFVEMFLLNNFE
jgi:hypothetical protein